MFAIGVEFLMGRAMMSQQNRQDIEWPPHPDRVFMALVAAWGESGEDERGAAALRFLESLSPPAMRITEDVSVRTSFISYVPVNDGCSPISKKGKAETPMGALPIGRSRQPRFFPAFTLADPRFHLVWPNAELGEHRAALESVCEQVTYLGHSASPVRMWIDDAPDITANLFPVKENAKCRLRGFGPGRTDYLKRQFDEFVKSGFNPGLRPRPSLWVGYGPNPVQVEKIVEVEPYEPALLVFRVAEGRRLALESCGLVADAIRRTLMSRHGGTPPEWLSGHQPDNAPSQMARPLYLPLGFVGGEHADGHLLGVAIAIPTNDFSSADFQKLDSLLRNHGEPEDIAATGVGYLRLRWAGRNETCLELDDRPFNERALALRPQTWTAPSDCWTTVTPIVLPRFPRRRLTPVDVISDACVSAGYPRPEMVRLGYAPLLRGVPHARSFPSLARKPGMPPRLRMHAEIRFPRSVRGPVVIGAARNYGFGFCRPTPDSLEHTS